MSAFVNDLDLVLDEHGTVVNPDCLRWLFVYDRIEALGVLCNPGRLTKS